MYLKSYIESAASVPCFPPLRWLLSWREAAARRGGGARRGSQRVGGRPGAPRMCEPCAPDALLEAVRGLRVAEPDLGLKPLLAKLREQRPELGAATKEVREALATLKAESEAAAKPTVAPPAAAKHGAPSNVALSLACIGCARLPSEMPDGREKHPICDKCKELKLQTTYMCGMNCPGNPGAWDLHGMFHKKLRKEMKTREDGGATQQRTREAAER